MQGGLIDLQNEIKNSIHETFYELTTKTVNLPDEKDIRVWGIKAFTQPTIDNEITNIIHLDDISDNRSVVTEIILQLRKNNVCFHHVELIIEDFLICGI